MTVPSPLGKVEIVSSISTRVVVVAEFHNFKLLPFKVRKNGQQNRATCLATLLLNELNNDVATNVLQQIRLLTGLNMGGKTRNIAIQLVLQQCCKTSCTFCVARFSVPL